MIAFILRLMMLQIDLYYNYSYTRLNIYNLGLGHLDIKVPSHKIYTYIMAKLIKHFLRRICVPLVISITLIVAALLIAMN